MNPAPILKGRTTLVEQAARDSTAWIGDDGWLLPEKLPRPRWSRRTCVGVVMVISALWSAFILAAVSAGLL